MCACVNVCMRLNVRAFVRAHAQSNGGSGPAVDFPVQLSSGEFHRKVQDG